ncbi:MAG: undecaprenyl-diphosphate phosphatase [Patescibacteria group bacterium]
MSFSIVNELLLAVILGVIQGITEFLPVSSTAHLRLITGFLLEGKDIGLTTSNFIQFGTLIAILQYFKEDLKIYYKRIKQLVLSNDSRKEFLANFLSWWEAFNIESTSSKRRLKQVNELHITNQTDLILSQIIVGSMPLILLGGLLQSLANSNRSLDRIAWFLLIGSMLMYLGERIYKLAVNKSKPKVMSPSEVILIGLFQSLAAFPGISRSGATISGALMLGRDRAQSVKFSFLLSIPALTIISLIDLAKIILDLFGNGFNLLPTALSWSNQIYIHLSLVSLLVAFVIAYLVGLAVLRWLLRFLSTNTFLPFIIYRIALSLALFIVVFLQLV